MATLNEASAAPMTVRSSRWLARRPKWLLLIAVIGFAIPLLAAALSGNLTIPHNDSWSYSRAAETFANTGQIKLLNWNLMSLVGLLVVVWPIGSSLAAQQVAVAVMGLVCLYCVYDLVAPTVDGKRVVLAMALMTLWPGWASLTTSFMTDVPALLGTFGSLAIGRHALARDSKRLFWVALVVGFWAAAIREQALAAPIVLIAWGAFTHGRRERIDVQTLLVGAGVFIAAFVPFYLWREALPGGQHVKVVLNLNTDLHSLLNAGGQAYFTIACALSPAVFLTARPQHWRVRELAAVVLVVGISLYLWRHHNSLLLGNYLEPGGEYGAATAGTRAVLGTSVFHVLKVLALVSGVLMAGSIVERRRAADPVLTLFTALTAVITLLVAASGQEAFDRYLIALVPGVLAVLLARTAAKPGRQPQRAWSVPRLVTLMRNPAVAGALLLMGTVSALLAANAFSFDRAMWNEGLSVSAAGVPASRIDAGLDWMGWYSKDGAIYRSAPHRNTYGFYAGFFSKQLPCVSVQASPLSPATLAQSGWTQLSVRTYRTFLVLGSSRLYTYATSAADCTAAGGAEARIRAAGAPS